MNKKKIVLISLAIILLLAIFYVVFFNYKNNQSLPSLTTQSIESQQTKLSIGAESPLVSVSKAASKSQKAAASLVAQSVPNLPEALKSQATASEEQTQSSSTENYTLEMLTLGLSAPINLNVDGKNQEEYLSSLETGVAHLKQTALPGGKGNTVIFGHSSYYKYLPGNFKSIFAKNNELNVGDSLSINSASSQINYRITQKLVVEPDNVDIVSQNTKEHKLTLITCWPVYSTEKRLVIVAQKI